MPCPTSMRADDPAIFRSRDYGSRRARGARALAGVAMTLLVLGAAGGVGRWLVQLAQGQGNQVTAIARATARYAPPAGVRLVEGDVLSEPLLIQAMQGQHAVASCLGNRRLGKSPWARLQSPADFVAGATRAIVEAMRASEVRRIVAISGAGVGDSRSVHPRSAWLGDTIRRSHGIHWHAGKLEPARRGRVTECSRMQSTP